MLCERASAPLLKSMSILPNLALAWDTTPLTCGDNRRTQLTRVHVDRTRASARLVHFGDVAHCGQAFGRRAKRCMLLQGLRQRIGNGVKRNDVCALLGEEEDGCPAEIAPGPRNTDDLAIKSATALSCGGRRRLGGSTMFDKGISCVVCAYRPMLAILRRKNQGTRNGHDTLAS